MLKQLNIGLVALVLGFGLIITQSAFKGTTSNRYHFIGETSANYSDESKWVAITTTEPSDCDNEAELPCIIDIPGSLSSYLSGKTFNDVMNSPELESSKAAVPQ